jgi:Ser/Thr protein kinase RdoA (MazF antagonist)
MLEAWLRGRYGLDAERMVLLFDHGQNRVYKVAAGGRAYLVKETSLPLERLTRLGALTQRLLDSGVRVAAPIRTLDGAFAAAGPRGNVYVQDFVEGETFRLNEAPGWYLDQSPRLLSRIRRALAGVPPLPACFDEAFLDPSTPARAMQALADREEAAARRRHLERVSGFHLNAHALTRANSHGDFYIGQTICRGREVTVIDWDSACCLPVCFELIMSYTYADPRCAQGRIDVDGLRRYLDLYLKDCTMQEADIRLMPYFYYHQLAVCNFTPPYEGLSPDYTRIATLCDRLMDWLYDHVETLSDALLH